MSQPHTGSIHALLNIICPIKIVDIGANPIDGKPPYAQLLASGHAHIVGFEPNLQALATLNTQKGAKDTYLPYAIGDGTRQTLNICLAPGMTSLLKPNLAVMGLFYNFAELARIVATEEIDTMRLDDVVETAGLDYLKIDIQGGELMVFQNAPQRLAQAVCIQTEVEFMPMYEGQPLFSEVEQHLRSQGFMLHRFEPMYTRTMKPVDPFAGLNQLLWADAIFIRDVTKLDAMSTEQLLKLAVILHECYKSYDVALVLLTEYDRRLGTQHGPRYQAIIKAAETILARDQWKRAEQLLA